MSTMPKTTAPSTAPIAFTLPTDGAFTGAIPALYEQLLVPLIFAPYAADMAARVAAIKPKAVLEVAAGTGAVTRAMAHALPASCTLIATDINAAMLEHAQAIGTARPVQWRTADALQLPFDDDSVDVVVCQFGVMFFPDKPAALAEARRVLRPGGTLLFSVWDRLETNELADTATAALKTLFPDDPPRFLPRTPHGYHDTARIAADVAAGGFSAQPVIETLPARSVAESAWPPATAYCQGTPLRGEIESRGGVSLEQATEHVAKAIAQRFGPRTVDAGMQAIVVSVVKS